MTANTQANPASDSHLTKDDIKHIATLARLAVSDEKASEYANDLNSILGLMDTLKSIDTDGISPMASPHAVSQPLRTDEVTESNQREALLANAPDAEKGLFKVPQVIE